MPAYWYNKDGTRKPEYKGKKYKKKYKGTGKSVLDKLNMKITKKASDDDRKAREKAGAVA